MKLLCIDGRDVFGFGGALRGRELAFALSQLGHEIVVEANLSPAQLKEMKVQGVIETGTWHLLQGGSGTEIVRRSRICDSLGIPSVWWFGSNGSVWGVRVANEQKRRESEEGVLSLIRERKFIGVICPYSMDIYSRYNIPKEKMRLIPSVFDGDLFTPQRFPYDKHVTQRMFSAFGIPQTGYFIGTAGNTPNSKGGDFVIQAVKLLEKEMPDLHYIILHSPDFLLTTERAKSPDGLREGLSELDVLQRSKQLAQTLGIAQRVHFIGTRLLRTHMPSYYRMLNAYCSPSEAENLGQPLVESQLCGLPLLTYKGFSFDFVSCPTTATQVEPDHTETDDYGLVIPKGNPALIAEGIKRQREIGETVGTREATRMWAYEKFHHHNAVKMINALAEYREMMK